MSKDAINAVGNQHVIILLVRLNEMIKRLSGGHHGHGSYRLRSNGKHQSPVHDESRKIPLRPQARLEGKLYPRRECRRSVASGMINEKGIRRSSRWIVQGRGKVFRQVKNG